MRCNPQKRKFRKDNGWLYILHMRHALHANTSDMYMNCGWDQSDMQSSRTLSLGGQCISLRDSKHRSNEFENRR